MEKYFGELLLVRWIFEKGMAITYLIAFLTALNQFRPLLGEKGLLPTPDFLRFTNFKNTPSIFHFHYSDRLATVISWLGILISCLLITGTLNDSPWWFYTFLWLIIWFLYLSIVNVGQTFYSFGWESMLCEAGFFTAFIGPQNIAPSIIPILILRWMLFRVEFGAGLIKLRHDPCWRDFTCLYYHYETQPMPGPLSWHFHYFPKFVHRFGVFFSHFVQVVVPFGIFAPQPIAGFAALLMIFHQLWLIFCGNYSWLNWLTVILGFTALSDGFLQNIIPISNPEIHARSMVFDILLYALLLMTIILSWKPLLNFFSKDQLMNYSYNPYHLVGVYGAFGSITKERYEIIVEGTLDEALNENTQWQEYEFKGKPGKLNKTPRQYAPYHLRLDWLMWFLPFSVLVKNNSLLYISTKKWFLKFIEKILENDKVVMDLLSYKPFQNAPKYIRCRFYRYRFTTKTEKKETGNIWKRTLIGEYLDPLSLSEIKSLLNQND